MHYQLLSKEDIKTMDALKAFHGGSRSIVKTIEKMRDFETRKKILKKKGFGSLIDDAEKWVRDFQKFEDFAKANNFHVNPKYGTARSQVSGFQGAYVTHHAMRRIAESSRSAETCFVPTEMVSVVGLTDHYVYSGDLLATLTMAENVMKASKFCSTNLIGTPQPETRFRKLEKVTGKNFERRDLGKGISQLILKNQGTFFGNFGGIEVANDNHLIYLDGITRAALETGGNFYLNPSWSTITSVCYYARDIQNLTIKISMLLSTQNLIQFRMLMNIIKEYIREDGTSPIYEINIGNGASAETFIRCAEELDKSGIKGISLAAHIYINPDLGIEGFDWTENMFRVLKNGTNMTFKYESDGTAREMDTMEAYFLPDEDRNKAAKKIGDVIYYKCIRATKDGILLMKQGVPVVFAKNE